MQDLQTLSDRIEIDSLQGEFTDAVMMNDHERLAALFTDDGAVRIPDAALTARGHEAIVEMGRHRESFAEIFVQLAHRGVVTLDGDTATGRAYLTEVIRTRAGQSHLNHAIYHDTYARTPDGWRFAERTYEIRYLDTSPLAGSAIASDAPLVVPS